MKLLAIISLFLVQAALACEVHLPHQMVVFSDENSGKSVYRSTNCNSQVLDDLHHIITSTEGRIASYQIKEMMNAKNHVIEITPHSVVIQQLRSLIREQMILPTGMQVKATRAINNSGILALPAGDKIEVSCNSCLYGSQQTINVIIRGFDGTSQTLWASADFMKMVIAYRLTAPFPSFSSLSESSSLKEEYIEAIPHTDLITDMNTLKFYITNKPLKTGELLRKSDLNAVNLVRAGLKTEVVLENQMVRIKTQGISRSNGTIGELVEVFHPQKNKKYQGKVIDINKVLVEL
jgi:flagella basal body P-ring formation protein FlgA